MAAPHYPAGVYVASVVAQALGKAGTGTPQFILRVKILGQPDPERPENYIAQNPQYERTIYRALTEKTFEYAAEDFRVLGYDGSKGITVLDPSHPQHVSFAGQVIDVLCKHEKAQDGTDRERWSIYTNFASQPIDAKPLTKDEGRNLDALFGVAMKGKPKPQPRPATVPAAAATDDDFIP